MIAEPNIIDEALDEMMEEGGDVQVRVPGKLSSIARQIVGRDNAQLSDRQVKDISPDEQRERLSRENRELLKDHPEFIDVAVHKIIGRAQGEIARAGLSVLLEAFTKLGENKQLVLVIEESLTVKISASRYVPFALLTWNDMWTVHERLGAKADELSRLAKLFGNGLSTVGKEMKGSGATTLRELASDGKTIEIHI